MIRRPPGYTLTHSFPTRRSSDLCTPAQLARAWLLAQGQDIVPIPGTRRITRLDENAGAARITLGDAEVKRIDAVLDSHAVAGTRYPEAGLASVKAGLGGTKHEAEQVRSTDVAVASQGA